MNLLRSLGLENFIIYFVIYLIVINLIGLFIMYLDDRNEII